MGVQSLRLREPDRRGGERREACSVATDERTALQEIENAETRGKPRAPGRRQDMVGTSDIVADRLGCVTAEKDRPGMIDPLGQRVGLIEREFEMLGRDPVD